MTDLVLAAESLLNHDRTFYFSRCAWCNRPVGEAACDHSRELELQSRGRSRDLHRARVIPFRPSKGPWFPLVLDVGLRPWPAPGAHLLPAAQPLGAGAWDHDQVA